MSKTPEERLAEAMEKLKDKKAVTAAEADKARLAGEGRIAQFEDSRNKFTTSAVLMITAAQARVSNIIGKEGYSLEMFQSHTRSPDFGAIPSAVYHLVPPDTRPNFLQISFVLSVDGDVTVTITGEPPDTIPIDEFTEDKAATAFVRLVEREL
jgi:hypothetical protein